MKPHKAQEWDKSQKCLTLIVDCLDVAVSLVMLYAVAWHALETCQNVGEVGSTQF